MNIANKITKDTILFFDMDGTLIDTNLANFLSYEKAIKLITKTNIDLTYNPAQRFTCTELLKAVSNLSISEYDMIFRKKNIATMPFYLKPNLSKILLIFFSNIPTQIKWCLLQIAVKTELWKH